MFWKYLQPAHIYLHKTGKEKTLQVSDLFKHHKVSLLFAPAKSYGQKSCEFNDKVTLFDFTLFFNYINSYPNENFVHVYECLFFVCVIA